MSFRLEKVKSQLKRILGNTFVHKSGDFGIGMVSINDIVVSRDLSSAKVWVSFLNQPNQEAAFKKLLKQTKEIQSTLYQELPIKKVPKIIWQLDVDPDASNRIESILDDIKRTETSDPEI